MREKRERGLGEPGGRDSCGVFVEAQEAGADGADWEEAVKIPPIQVLMKTTDGVLIVHGLMPFVACDRLGYPLEFLVSDLRDNGMAVDWHSFVRCAARAGWKKETTLAKIHAAMDETYGREFADEVMRRLELPRAEALREVSEMKANA